MSTNEYLAKWPEVRRITTLSYSQVNRLEKRGQFPKRVRLSEQRVAWRLSEIQEWIEGRLSTRSA